MSMLGQEKFELRPLHLTLHTIAAKFTHMKWQR